MNPFERILGGTLIRSAAALLSIAGLMSCSHSPAAPQGVQATPPSAAYTFASDSDLVEASKKAEDYCRQYDSRPRTSSIANNGDGTKTITFECNTPSIAHNVPKATDPAPKGEYPMGGRGGRRAIP